MVTETLEQKPNIETPKQKNSANLQETTHGLPRGLVRIEIGKDTGVLPISRVSELTSDAQNRQAILRENGEKRELVKAEMELKAIRENNRALLPPQEANNGEGNIANGEYFEDRRMVTVEPVEGVEAGQTKLYHNPRAGGFDNSGLVLGYSPALEIPIKNDPEKEQARLEQLGRVRTARVEFVHGTNPSESDFLKSRLGLGKKEELTQEMFDEAVADGKISKQDEERLNKQGYPYRNTLIVTSHFKPGEQEYTNTSYYNLTWENIPKLPLTDQEKHEVEMNERARELKILEADEKQGRLKTKERKRLQELQADADLVTRVRTEEQENNIREQLEQMRTSDENAVALDETPTDSSKERPVRTGRSPQERIVRFTGIVESKRQRLNDLINQGELADPEEEKKRQKEMAWQERQIDAAEKIVADEEKKAGLSIPRETVTQTAHVDSFAPPLPPDIRQSPPVTYHEVPQEIAGATEGTLTYGNTEDGNLERPDNQLTQAELAERNNQPSPYQQELNAKRKKEKDNASPDQPPHTTDASRETSIAPENIKNPEGSDPEKKKRRIRDMTIGVINKLRAADWKKAARLLPLLPIAALGLQADKLPVQHSTIGTALHGAVGEIAPLEGAGGVLGGSTENTGNQAAGTESQAMEKTTLGPDGLWGVSKNEIANYYGYNTFQELQDHLTETGLTEDQLTGIINGLERAQKNYGENYQIPNWHNVGKTTSVDRYNPDQVQRYMDLALHKGPFMKKDADKMLVYQQLVSLREGGSGNEAMVNQYIATGELPPVGLNRANQERPTGSRNSEFAGRNIR